ncbi:MAG: GntR family transcriptional regulator [Acidimicrobiales bacterium]
MILRVDASDALPVYEQIRQQLLAMIASGVLAPGAQLPTIRQLAADLGLAKGTVSRAYESLLRDRAVESRGRSGTVVAAPPAGRPRRPALDLATDAADRLAVASVQASMSAADAHLLLDQALGRLGKNPT